MLPNQMFNAVLSSLRTFDPLSDTLDILIISFVFYQLLQFARKSRAGQLVKGIILILVFYGLAVMLNLKTVTWVLNNVITIGFMAAVVIFQPELRRTLERMGQSTMWANLLVGNRRSDPSLRGAWQSAVVAICDAAEQLSDTRTGALMVLERNNNLDEIIRTGTPMSSPKCSARSSMKARPCTTALSSSATASLWRQAACCRCPTILRWARTWAPATARASA